MPRGRAHSNNRSSLGHNSASLVAVDRILARNENFREGIQQNHTLSCYLAGRLPVDGEIEQAMLTAASSSAEDGGGDDNDQTTEIQNFLNKQRNRLIALSERNVRSGRNADAFINALQEVRGQVQQSNQMQPSSQEDPADAGGAENIENFPDYEEIIAGKMKNYQKHNQKEQLPMENEGLVRDLRDRLGLPAPGNNADNDGEEEELEVLRQPEGTQSLKCPVTCMYFEEPVKSKVCGHVYSMAGLRQMLGNKRSCNCPVPGCASNMVTMDSVEKDIEMEMKVKSQLRREARERQQRRSQMVDSDDEAL